MILRRIYSVPSLASEHVFPVYFDTLNHVHILYSLCGMDLRLVLLLRYGQQLMDG